MRVEHTEEEIEGLWLYGVNPVLEALKAGHAVGDVYIWAGRKQTAEIKAEAEARGLPVKVMHDPEFFDRRFPKGHQGVAALVKAENLVDLDALMEIPTARAEAAFFVVLDQVEDPRNLGAILRSAEAAGAHGVVMQERRSAPLGPVAMKTSAGAAGLVPICVVTNIKEALRRMEDEGYAIVGADADGDVAPWALDLSGPVALVIGSEGSGMRRTVKESCHHLLALPMRGRVASLNASVAAGVIIYEIVRQRV
jgi:23S rRNA (guanosine2251-2'-O)-methyltransferase